MSTTMMVTNMMIMNGEDIDDVDIISAGVELELGMIKCWIKTIFNPWPDHYHDDNDNESSMMMVMMVVLMMVVSSTLAT